MNFRILCLVLKISTADGVVYLRPWNDRGPAAVKAGTDCIQQVERVYFQNKESNQVPNLSLFHTKNLSSPSMEIEVQYLFDLHDRILNHDEGEIRFQLKVISDDPSSTLETTIMDVTLTEFYIIVTDYLKSFINSIDLISNTKSFNEEAKYLILFNNPDKREGGKKLACEIMNILFEQYQAINVVVMFANDAFSYEIYTGNPYGKVGETCITKMSSTCGSMKVISVGICTRGALSNRKSIKNILDIDKIPKEMDIDCKFHFCARVQEPFVYKNCTDGLEIQIMQFLQQEMNFKLQTKCLNMDRGEPLGNGSWSHLLGEVKDDACDIIAGGFFSDPDVHAVFAATDYYLEDIYTFFIPKAPYAPRWKGLINIFTPELWYAALTVFIMSLIVWTFLGMFTTELSQHHRPMIVFLHVLAVTFGISIHSHPKLNPLRFFFAILALYSLVLTALYTSKLITVFTNPIRDYQIDSVEELLETDLLIGGRSENIDWFDNGDPLDVAIYQRYNFSAEFRPSEKTLKDISNSKMALVISKNYVRQSLFRDKIFGLTVPLFSSNLEMLCERGFPLLRRINRILGQFRDSGIMAKLRNDFQFNTTILIAIKELKKVLSKGELDYEVLVELDDIVEKDEEIGPQPLNVENLMATWSLLVVGESISLVFFLLEIITDTKIFKKYYKKLKKILCKKELFSFAEVVATYANVMKMVPKNNNKTEANKNLNLHLEKENNENLKVPRLRKYVERLKIKTKPIELMQRRKRRFVYRTVRFTPISRRYPLKKIKKSAKNEFFKKIAEEISDNYQKILNKMRVKATKKRHLLKD